MTSLTRRRWGLAVGTIALVGYGVAFAFFVDVDSLDLGLRSLLLVLLAAVLQMLALWLFGELFRQGVAATGRRLSPWQGFRAALVGSSVARLLPAGGAVTPVAMAWTVRQDAPGSSGAAVRATALNYAGLVLVTALGLFVYSLVGDHPETATTLRVVSGVAGALGLAIVAAAARLRALSSLLPDPIRRRLGQAMLDLPVDFRSHFLLWGRVGTETVVLGLVLTAFGIELGAVETLAAFGVSQLAAGIPGTPGGIGFAEAGLVGALAFFGVGAVTAVAPVLVFRVVSYWLPAGAGLVVGTSSFLSSPEGAEI